MRKVDLQQQAVTLIGQLPTEKLKSAVDYLAYLQNKEMQNVQPAEPHTTTALGTAIHTIFKPFGGVELELPPREAMRKPPCLD